MKTIGACCKNLGISISPEELQLSYRAFLQARSNGSDQIQMADREHGLSKASPLRVFQDIHLIYPMLEFLYADNVHPNGDIKTERTVYHYRCRHSDDKLKKCAIYDIRPAMCVTFPVQDGTHCKYKGCACPSDGRKEWKLQQEQKRIALIERSKMKGKMNGRAEVHDRDKKDKKRYIDEDHPRAK